MNSFSRRTYDSLGDALADVRAIFARWKEIGSLMRGKGIDPAFRERLMLVVTEVNGCRYCSYAHTRTALAKGLTEEEIEALTQGTLAGSPEEEMPALLYAQHWAETDGRPDPSARQRVLDLYGEKKVEKIELILGMIRMGNLMGNTWDYVLYRISGGRWGAPERARQEEI
ncbi:MAG: carboxymuconolactone decarboxylase family protein [Chloroflexota bacterium]